MKKVTISDVAREAKVSKSTVSRVLNDVPNVATELRERVLQAIDKLDYQPSRAARTLRKDLRDMVGFIVPSIKDTIFGSVLQGAQDFAYQNQIGIFAYSTTDDLERQQMYFDSLLSEQLAGLVIVPAPGTNPKVLASMKSQGLPIVLLDRKLPGFEADFIGSDNLQGAYDAVHHLINQGYRCIATIAGSQNVSTGIERLTGYRMALTEANLEINPNWITYGNFNRQTSFLKLKSLMQLDNPPDAVFVANDEMAIGALQAIQDLDLQVPDELALVCFDELPLANLLTPSLTTIEQSTQVLGEEALRLLIDLIKQTDRSMRLVQIPTKLNARASSRNMLR